MDIFILRSLIHLVVVRILGYFSSVNTDFQASRNVQQPDASVARLFSDRTIYLQALRFASKCGKSAAVPNSRLLDRGSSIQERRGKEKAAELRHVSRLWTDFHVFLAPICAIFRALANMLNLAVVNSRIN